MLHQESFAPVIIPAADRIKLNEKEQRIFDLLRDCVRDKGLKVEMRVAGGWVRDKLLRIDCKDVDIALDTMMGEAFAGQLCDYMRQLNLEPRGIGVIQSNPDRSKHLETATIHIFDQPIDFVNLRAEEYAAGSRIPEKIVFGTPLQDALRRDITINSLFYHLQNNTIEDWTGRGLMDLEEGIIRTPLAPETTLLDDPLRLLRTIRFASRYGYAPIPDIIEASLKQSVQDAFLAKVSRERVGIEFDKTISDPNGLQGLHLYNRFNAFPLLVMHLDPVDYAMLLSLFTSIVWSGITADEHRLALLCCPLVPFNSTVEKIQEIVKNALKLPNKDVQDTFKVLKNTRLISEYAEEKVPDPVKLGRLIRDIGYQWRLSIRLACLQRAFESHEPDATSAIKTHQELVSIIENLDLCEAWKFTPILTGNQVRDLLQLKEGKEIGVRMTQLMDWQFAHPRGTPDDAKTFLLSKST